VAVFLGDFNDQVFAHADRIIVSPGISLDTPQIQAALARGVPVISDIELFLQAVHAPVVAITGSNGKSTVTSLVGEMSRASGIPVAIGGNLGTPALDLLDAAAQLYVLELSSFQLESTFSLQATVATVLNISADHLDRHGDLARYAATKSIALQNAKFAVFNADDPTVIAMSGPEKRFYFSLQTPQNDLTFGIRQIDGADWLCQGTKPLLATQTLLLPGRHNQANALASLAIGTALEIPLDSMLQVLETFPGLPHRTAFIAEINGVRWFNDSKATNVGATIAALEGMHQTDGGRAIILLGGTGKAADFSPLTPTLARCARAVVLFGQDRELIKPHVPNSCTLANVEDLATAIIQAANLAQPGDHVLLSPACASFDQFANFAERGDQFSAWVQQLAQQD
jgi:UDP-N-acetylmuramoylalanine--D-glutamate ligase